MAWEKSGGFTCVMSRNEYSVNKWVGFIYTCTSADR